MAATDSTEIVHRAPRRELRPFVRQLLVVESTAAREDVHLPDTGFVAAFSFRGECRLEDGGAAPLMGLTGLWDRTRRHAHGRGHSVVLAAFTPLGASALLRQPLDELANATLDLGDLLERPEEMRGLPERLAAEPSHEARISRVEDFLLARIGEARLDPLVSAAAAWIERTDAEVRIEELARRTGLSLSALERRFRRRVGTSPRRFASIVRLRKVDRLRAAGVDLTTIAHAAGYCDQSHFIRDFKRFTGQAPGAYFSQTAAH